MNIRSISAEDTHRHEEHKNRVVATCRADRAPNKALVLLKEHVAAVVGFQGV